MWLMKKLLFIFILIIIAVFAGFSYFKKPASQISPPNKVLSAAQMPTGVPVILQSTVIDSEGTSIRISWTFVDPEKTELYSNLKEQHLSEQIKVDKSCQILVNGGFYSKENTHLGLFIANFETISKPIQSALLNGFLSINSRNVSIKDYVSGVSPRIAIQSGPLLMQNGKALALNIKNDEPSRRIVAGITDDNKLIFLAFYRDDSDYQGPLLGSLPEIISLFKKHTGINITDAINLDGGSASVFITNYVLLRELTRIGSYFCVR
jgi:uncharacterized protein YigE (DUF2233 family)